MSVTCPKCNYTRQPGDTAPAYECPRCGIIYAKYGATVHTTEAPPKAQTTHRRKTFLAGIVLLAIGLGGWQWTRISTASKQEADAAAQLRAEAAANAAARMREEAALEERRRAEEEKRSVEKAVEAIAGQYRKWTDASRLASSTGRIALSGPVSALQALHRETEAMIVPPCLDQAKAALVKGMGHEVDGFVIFMQNPVDMGSLLAQGYFEDARNAFKTYEAGVSGCTVQ